MKNTTFANEFLSAVEKKDLPYIKAYIASVILNDPRFEQAKCHDYMDYVRSHNLNITEPFKLNVSENVTPTDKSKWDKGLFRRKVEYLRLNFAYDERIKELEQIGKVAFEKPADDEASVKKTNNNTECFSNAPKRGRSKKKASPFAILGVIAAIAAIVTAIMIIVKR